MHHELKIQEGFFERKKRGIKNWEIRSTDDRNFYPGDTVTFFEVDKLGIHTLEELGPFEVTYVLAGVPGLKEGYAIFSHTPVAKKESAARKEPSMANERVPLSQRIRPSSEAAQWVCDEVAELERLLEEAREAARTARAHMHSDGRCVEIVMSERDAALAQVRVLREAIDPFHKAGYYPGRNDKWTSGPIDRKFVLRMDEVFKNTSATAQQFVEKIEREAVEKFFAIITDPGNEIVWVRPSGRSIHADPRFIRAAILGEKEEA